MFAAAQTQIFDQTDVCGPQEYVSGRKKLMPVCIKVHFRAQGDKCRACGRQVEVSLHKPAEVSHRGSRQKATVDATSAVHLISIFLTFQSA